MQKPLFSRIFISYTADACDFSCGMITTARDIISRVAHWTWSLRVRVANAITLLVKLLCGSNGLALKLQRCKVAKQLLFNSFSRKAWLHDLFSSCLMFRLLWFKQRIIKLEIKCNNILQVFCSPTMHNVFLNFLMGSVHEVWKIMIL